MSNYKTKGINLKSAPSGESDKIITILTSEHGKIKAIAKGARKTKSKFGARLDILAYNDLLIGIGKNLDVISQVETIETFYPLRSNLKLLDTAFQMVKLSDEVSQIKIKNKKLFDLLLCSLHLLKNGAYPNIALKFFEIKLMDIEGVFPILDKCVKCSKSVPKNIKSIRFNSVLGGVICYKCSTSGNGSVKIPYNTVDLMLNIKNKKNINTNLAPETLGGLECVIKNHIDTHLRVDYANT